MPQPAESPWLPKAAAAALLGVSPRSLERHEAKGFIEKRVRRSGPLGRANAVEYSRADLEALKRGAPNVHARPEPEESSVARAAVESPITPRSASTALAVRHDSRVDSFAAALFAHLEAGRLSAPPAPKPWLTLAEAAEYSGLTRRFLTWQAKYQREAGNSLTRIVAVNIGLGKRAQWRFQRDSLGAVRDAAR